MNHSSNGGNFLWGDGHVTFEATVTANLLISEISKGHNPPQILAASGGAAQGR